MIDTSGDTADRELVYNRRFNAPRDLVFAAWTNSDHIGQWWGPRGFTTTTYEMDVRPGGVWRYTMHGPDGTDYPNEIRYLEVVEPERLVYEHSTGVEGDPNMFHVTVTFTDRGATTELTMRSIFPSSEVRDEVVKAGAVEGANQTLDRLSEFLATT